LGHKMREWLVYGFETVAAGANEWKYIWFSLQSSPIWGSLSVYVNKQLTFENEEFNAALTYTPLQDTVDEPDLDLKITWRHDITVGPENSRRKMEQDFTADFTSITVEDMNNSVVVKERVVSAIDVSSSIEQSTATVETSKTEVKSFLKEILQFKSTKQKFEGENDLADALDDSSLSFQKNVAENILEDDDAEDMNTAVPIKSRRSLWMNNIRDMIDETSKKS